MWNIAVSRDPEAARRISTAPTRARRDAEETTQAEALARAISEKISSTGVIQSSTKATGAGTLVFRPGGALGTIAREALGVGGEFTGVLTAGRENREAHNYNLVYGTIRRIQETAWKNAEKAARKVATRIDGTLDRKAYDAAFRKAYEMQYTSAVSDLTHGIDAAAKQKTEFSFGAFLRAGCLPWHTSVSPGN